MYIETLSIKVNIEIGVLDAPSDCIILADSYRDGWEPINPTRDALYVELGSDDFAMVVT